MDIGKERERDFPIGSIVSRDFPPGWGESVWPGKGSPAGNREGRFSGPLKRD